MPVNKKKAQKPLILSLICLIDLLFFVYTSIAKRKLLNISKMKSNKYFLKQRILKLIWEKNECTMKLHIINILIHT